MTYLVKFALLMIAELGFRIPLEWVKLSLRYDAKVGRKRYMAEFSVKERSGLVTLDGANRT